MPILDPYETSYGKLINKARLIKEVRDYVLTSSNPLNYEYKTNNDSEIAFITGCIKEEENLPLFDHPLIFKNIKDTDVVAVDLRKFLKNEKEQPLELQSIVRDGAGYSFSVLRGLLTADFLAHEYGNLRQCYGSISMALAHLVSSLIDHTIKLNPEEKLYVEVGVAFYANLLFIDAKDFDDLKPNLIARVSNFRYSLAVTKTIVNKILENVGNVDQDINGLLTVIKQVLPEEKSTLVNDTVLVNLLSNVWYGPGGTETVVIGLEHMPTWIAVVFVSLAEMSYKRSRLSTTFNKYSKSIDPKDFVKNIENYIKEKQ